MLPRSGVVAAVSAFALTLLAPAAAQAADVSTTSSSPSASTAKLGDPVTDSASVTGDLLAGVPSGSVTFSACGPLTSPSGCPMNAGIPVAVVPLTPGLLDVASASSPSFIPTTAGTWCFRADYSGDSNYDPSSDGTSAECFTVPQDSSSTSSAPQRPSIALGENNTDTATIKGTTGGGSPTGTVSFFACGPLSSPDGCATGGQAVGSPITVTPGADGTTANATSSGFTPTGPGTWCLRAEYSGDGNYTVSSDSSAGECFVVGKAAPTVASAPTTPTVSLAGSASDRVVATGNPTTGSPTGTVTVVVCGPLQHASGCAGAGQRLGSPITLVPSGDGTTAAATSSGFTPTAPGVWCFRAGYSGDGNYSAASDVGSGACFTVPQAHAPSASIVSPTANASYAVGQVVPAKYSCAEDAGGPGLSSCTGAVADGSRIDTSSPGIHMFSVTATSRDGLSTPVFVRYTVARAPSVSISMPADGATYTLGQGVGVNVNCAEGQYGSGLKSCSSPTRVDTSHTGAFAFSATVTSVDGQSATSTIHYRVVAPSNHFVVSRLRRHRDGRVTFVIAVPAPGTVKAIATASARAGKPRPFVVGRLHRLVSHATKMPLIIRAGPRARPLIRHRMRLRVVLTVTFTPTGSASRTARFSRVPLAR